VSFDFVIVNGIRLLDHVSNYSCSVWRHN